MSLCFSLSRFVCVPILTEWLVRDDIAIFDTALRNKDLRRVWITIVENHPSIIRMKLESYGLQHLKIVRNTLTSDWAEGMSDIERRCLQCVKNVTICNSMERYSNRLSRILDLCIEVKEVFFRHVYEIDHTLYKVARSCRMLRKCVLEYCGELSDQEIRCLFRCSPLLEEFTCDYSEIDGSAFATAVVNCRHLCILSMEEKYGYGRSNAFRGSQTFLLHSVTALKSIKLRMGLESEAILYGWHGKTLTSLPSEPDLEEYAPIIGKLCPNLTSMNLFYPQEDLTELKIEGIPPQLTELQVNCRNISLEYLEQMFRICRIRKLEIIIKNFTPPLYDLACAHLEELSISSIDVCLPLFSKTYAPLLNNLRVLEVWSGSGTKVIQDVAKYVPRLEKLTLVADKVDTSTLKLFALHCPKLTCVRTYTESHVTLSGLHALVTHCTHLTSLDCDMCDADVRTIVKLAVELKRNLMEMRFDYTSSVQAFALRLLPNLTWIEKYS